MTLERNPNFMHPTLQNSQDFQADAVMLLTSCQHLGTVVAFYPANQTADVTLDYLKVNYVYNPDTGLYSVETTPYPPIKGAPVKFDMGQNGGMTVPVAAGDRCVVRFNDRDMDAWYVGASTSGKPQPPPSGRLHAFPDAIVELITCPAVPIQNFDSARPMLRDGSGNVYVAVDPSTHKIQLKNQSQNLATILQSILTHVQSLASAAAAITVPVTTAPGTSGPPLNAATFTNLATQLATDATNLQGLLE